MQTETVMPLNRRARRAMRFQPATPLATTIRERMTETGATTWGPAGSHVYASHETRRARRAWLRAKPGDARCCPIDFMTTAEQRRLGDQHDQDVERTGRPHGAGCHFCS